MTTKHLTSVRCNEILYQYRILIKIVQKAVPLIFKMAIFDLFRIASRGNSNESEGGNCLSSERIGSDHEHFRILKRNWMDDESKNVCLAKE
uniref:Uncharacterized protein n=1 Tax=Pristionchus pacificus TaxID=54126 RepID=A0A2A6CYQ3_PRIPA